MRWPCSAALIISLCRVGSAEPMPAAVQPTPGIDASRSPTPAVSHRRELARQWFSTAVSLARAGQYAAAKSLFLQAYAAEPHYLVLYNIARADIELGELTSAVAFLRRFLVEGTAALSDEQRRGIEREIEDLEARANQPRAETIAAAQPTSGEGSASTTGGQPSTPLPAGPAHSPPMQRMGETKPARSAGVDPPARSASPDAASRLPEYAFIGSGFAVVGAGIGLFVWNHERHQRWRRENDALTAYAGGSAQTSSPPRPEEAVLQTRVAQNNDLLESIQSFDPWPVITIGVGVAAMGAGVWSLIAADGSELWLSGGPSEVELRGQWTW